MVVFRSRGHRTGKSFPLNDRRELSSDSDIHPYGQCRDEGWTDKIKEQNSEGCRIGGRLRVNKVRVSFSTHFTIPHTQTTSRSSETSISAQEDPIRTISCRSNNSYVGVFSFFHNIHPSLLLAVAQFSLEQVPYLKDANHHDFGHSIHKFRFGADMTAEEEKAIMSKEIKTRNKLGIRDPLQGVAAHTEECGSQSTWCCCHLMWNFLLTESLSADYMFQCKSLRLSW